MRLLRLLPLLCAVPALSAQTLSDFSSFTPGDYSGSWNTGTSLSGPTTFAIGNFGAGQPVDSGSFNVWLGDAGQDWSAYTHIYLTGVAAAGSVPNAATGTLNFYVSDADYNTAIMQFSLASFATYGEVGLVMNLMGIDKTRVTDWGFGTTVSGTANFAFTFDRIGFSAAAVPEPSTAALLIGATTLCATGLHRRRRNP